MNKAVLLAAIAAATFSTSANAQEATLTGAKIGIVAGYDDYAISYEGEKIGSKSGFHYGLTAGYDFDLGGAIAGIEAEVADATTKVGYDGDSLKAGRELYVGARLGAVVSPNVILYAKGGYVNSRLKLTVDGESDGDNLDGWRLGAGVEYAPSTYFGRVEYRYSDFGDYKFEGENTGLSSRRHQVVATVGVRF